MRYLPTAVSLVLIGALFAACNTPGPSQPPPPPVDTETTGPVVLPIDTANFLPQDTGPETTPNLQPENWVYLFQTGAWTLGSANPPYGSVSGQFLIREYIDELDTALPAYECDVLYSLTGTEVNGHTCADCDFVMDVEHFVTRGDPSTCHDPDAPANGSVWQLGFDSGSATIFVNYYGTDVWLPWYDATKVGADVTYGWSATLAIEVEDTGDTN